MSLSSFFTKLYSKPLLWPWLARLEHWTLKGIITPLPPLPRTRSPDAWSNGEPVPSASHLAFRQYTMGRKFWDDHFQDEEPVLDDFYYPPYSPTPQEEPARLPHITLPE